MKIENVEALRRIVEEEGIDAVARQLLLLRPQPIVEKQSVAREER